jgi:hypothetical protein
MAHHKILPHEKGVPTLRDHKYVSTFYTCLIRMQAHENKTIADESVCVWIYIYIYIYPVYYEF